MRTIILTGLLLVMLAPIPVLADARDDALRLNDEGIRLVARGDYVDAIAKFTKARAILPSDPTLKKNLATARSKHATHLLAAGKEEEAVKQFRLAVALVPADPVHHANLGIALVRTGRAEDGLKSLLAAVRADPRCAPAHSELGSLYYREGDLNRSLASFRLAVKYAPKRTDLAKALKRVEREYEIEKNHRSFESDHFIISWDGDKDANVGARVKSILEDAYEEVVADLGIRPVKKTRVILYTRQNFKTVTGAHDWVGGLFDGRIRIPVKNFLSAEEEIRGTIRHEYTHVAVDYVTKKVPAWLNEGLAQYYERRAISGWMPLLKKAKNAKLLFSLEEITGNFTRHKDANRARLAYAQSHSLMLFIMEEYGPKVVGQFLKKLGEGKTAAEACRAAMHLSLEDLYEDWAESL
jgi:hypothetical protein